MRVSRFLEDGTVCIGHCIGLMEAAVDVRRVDALLFLIPVVERLQIPLFDQHRPDLELFDGPRIISVVVGILGERKSDLFEIADAVDCIGFFPGAFQRGQKSGDQNGDHRNRDQKFDQGKEKTRILFHC